MQCHLINTRWRCLSILTSEPRLQHHCSGLRSPVLLNIYFIHVKFLSLLSLNNFNKYNASTILGCRLLSCFLLHFLMLWRKSKCTNNTFIHHYSMLYIFSVNTTTQKHDLFLVHGFHSTAKTRRFVVKVKTCILKSQLKYNKMHLFR